MPDFVLEVASASTRAFDRTGKRRIYADLGVAECWRFDESPYRSNPGLAGDWLVDGGYRPILINTLPDGRLHGHSAFLNLTLKWHEGQLNWVDPETEDPFATIAQEREARTAAEARADEEREVRIRELEANREDREENYPCGH